MADNTELSAGSGGDIIATDDIGGVKHQRVKIVLGANNTSDGDVATGNPMPVSDAGGTLSVDDGGASLTVDGTVAVTHAGLTELAAAINASSQMDVNVAAALPAGANAIGKLAANSGVDIGDVDVTSIAAGNNIIGQVKLSDGTDVADVLDLSNSNPLAVALVDTNGDQISSFGGGTQYTEDAAAAANPVGTVPILVRTDTPATQVSADGDNIAQRGTNYGAAYVTILDGSGNIVAGSNQYTEDAAAAADPVGNALILVRKDTLAGVTSADGDNVAARGTDKGELYVKHADNVTVAVAAAQTLATVTTVGTVNALGAGTTGPMKAEDVAHSTGDQGIAVWGVRNDSPNATPTSADGDYGQLSTDRAGGLRLALYETDFAVLGTKHVKKYYTNAGAVTDGIVWSPAAGTRWYVTDLIVNVSAAATVTFEDDKSGGDEVVLKMELAANSGFVHHFATPLFSGEDAADLMVTTTAGNVYITAVGYEI